jgi:lysophospholipase L1-like esterase
MAYDVQGHGIDAILIQFGMNDCNYWESDAGLPRVNPSSFRENLREIINRAKHFGARKVILNTNHPTLKIQKLKYADISYQESNEEYNKIIREVSELENTRLIDIEQIWKGKIDNGTNLKPLLLEDQIHLSRLGHKLYYEIVMPVIEATLRELK